ncbi:MAG: hypothetical protein ISR57_06680 [Bacteroidales bacterium]|nr:hypothetical protein [Bacteroidota bacterium]MBL6950312.1 hypothetical protein [Bacteroidales bacterium]
MVDPIPLFSLGVILPMDQDKGLLRENALRIAAGRPSGNCNIDQKGNAVTPYEIFKISGSTGAYYFETISIVYPE